MALRIAESCINCGWCRPKCAAGAVRQVSGGFLIDAAVCTECAGVAGGPQCVAVCPIEGAIVRGT